MELVPSARADQRTDSVQTMREQQKRAAIEMLASIDASTHMEATKLLVSHLFDFPPNLKAIAMDLAKSTRFDGDTPVEQAEAVFRELLFERFVFEIYITHASSNHYEVVLYFFGKSNPYFGATIRQFDDPVIKACVARLLKPERITASKTRKAFQKSDTNKISQTIEHRMFRFNSTLDEIVNREALVCAIIMIKVAAAMVADRQESTTRYSTRALEMYKHVLGSLVRERGVQVANKRNGTVQRNTWTRSWATDRFYRNITEMYELCRHAADMRPHRFASLMHKMMVERRKE